MAQDDKTRAKAILDKHKGYLYGLNIDSLCDELSKSVMQWTFTVYEVFNLLSEQGYSQTELEQVATELINRINTTNLMTLAKSNHGSILLARIQYLMNCEANPNQQVCMHISTAHARTSGSTQTKIVHEPNQTSEPRKLSDEEIKFYENYNTGQKRQVKFNTTICWDLPTKGIGFVVYNQDDLIQAKNSKGKEKWGYDQIATKETIDSVMRLAREWYSLHPEQPLQIGDLSRPGGIDTPDHAGHENGKIVDLRPLRQSRLATQNAPLTYHQTAEYDLELTKEFIRLCFRLFPGMIIFFNDPNIANSTEFAGKIKTDKKNIHDNHLHLEFP